MDSIVKNEINRCLHCKTKPCQKGCPLGNDIPKIIEYMQEEKYDQAYELLTQTTVLPAICGRICPHTKQCQKKCTRGIKGNPIDIGSIEKTLGDLAINNNFKIRKFVKYNSDKKVAVIGAGPSGLTCAAFLARNGVDVTIYEKHDKLGGILSYGIPKFRLSEKTVDDTIKSILELGIDVKYNQELGKNLDLKEIIKKYDAVFLGIGANTSIMMNIQGENLEGVYGANQLLENNDKLNNLKMEGKNVIILGGGNVAIDMARVAKHKNAKTVTVMYRRSEKEMPAEDNEIKAAKTENINFEFQSNILNISKNNKELKAECIKTELVKAENDNRLKPVNINNSNYFVNCDMIIMAVGSKTESDMLLNLGLQLNQKGYVEVDENYKTSVEKVFAGGDLIGTKSTVAWASKIGRDAADKIKDYLKI